MSHYRCAHITGVTYFFTAVTYRRRAILSDDSLRAALRDALTTVRTSHPFVIHGGVLLPDHVHCL